MVQRVKNTDVALLGVILGLFLGGIFQAAVEINWKSISKKSQSFPKTIDIAQIKYNIIFKKSLADYKMLKILSGEKLKTGGKLKPEYMFYAMIMNEYYHNDTIYSDLHQALLEVSLLSPKDTLNLYWVKLLENTQGNH